MINPTTASILESNDTYNQTLRLNVKSLSSFKNPEAIPEADDNQRDEGNKELHNRLLSKYFTPKHANDYPGKKKFIINSHKNLLNSMQ